MPIDRIRANTLRLNVDDNKTIDVKVDSKRNAELNRALLNPEKFQEFSKNPKAFAEKYDLKIDKQISDQLVTKLDGIKDLDMLSKYVDPVSMRSATVWAVAVGAYSLASSKIAVAF